MTPRRLLAQTLYYAAWAVPVLLVLGLNLAWGLHNNFSQDHATISVAALVVDSVVAIIAFSGGLVLLAFLLTIIAEWVKENR